MLSVAHRAGTNRRTTLDQLLRHPIAPVIVGFILTGVIGWSLATWYTHRRATLERELAERKAYYETSTQAVQDFARTLYERYTRAEMLQSSLLRQAPLDEVRHRKDEYDRAFAAWGATHQANLLSIRKVSRSAYYTDLEHAVDMKLVPIMREVDVCLTNAYHQRVAGQATVRGTLQRCKSVHRLQASLDCSHAITSALFELAATAADKPGEAAQKDIDSKCR